MRFTHPPAIAYYREPHLISPLRPPPFFPYLTDCLRLAYYHTLCST